MSTLYSIKCGEITPDLVIHVRQSIANDHSLRVESFADAYNVDRFTLSDAVHGVTFDVLDNVAAPVNQFAALLSDKDVIELRTSDRDGTLDLGETVARFGITVDTIDRILNGSLFMHLNIDCPPLITKADPLDPRKIQASRLFTKGHTYSEIAVAMGVSVSAISKWCGVQTPKEKGVRATLVGTKKSKRVRKKLARANLILIRKQLKEEARLLAIEQNKKKPRSRKSGIATKRRSPIKPNAKSGESFRTTLEKYIRELNMLHNSNPDIHTLPYIAILIQNFTGRYCRATHARKMFASRDMEYHEELDGTRIVGQRIHYTCAVCKKETSSLYPQSQLCHRGACHDTLRYKFIKRVSTHG